MQMRQTRHCLSTELAGSVTSGTDVEVETQRITSTCQVSNVRVATIGELNASLTKSLLGTTWACGVLEGMRERKPSKKRLLSVAQDTSISRSMAVSQSISLACSRR